MSRMKKVNGKWQNVAVPEIDAFLAEIESVCRKHGMSISHEDSQGGFEVTAFNERDMDWLHGAADVREAE